MDPYKVEHFERTRGETFPAFETLDERTCARIRSEVAQKLVLPRTAGRLTIVETLFDQSIVLEGLNADLPDFSLDLLFRQAEIAPPEFVAIDWHRLDAIDRFRFADLQRYFREIRYPQADDITLFDDTLAWFIWIDHGGDITVNYL